MNLEETLQERGSFILIKSQDIQKLAEILANFNNQPAKESGVENPRAPVSQTEVMKRFNKTRQTIIRWRNKGILKSSFYIGGRVYFDPEELDALQRQNH